MRRVLFKKSKYIHTHFADQNRMASSSTEATTRWQYPHDVVPPFRFACVEEGLFRGAYPTLRNFPFLKQMGIRAILSVTPEPATYDLKTFCKSESIELRYIQAERHKGDPQMLPNELNEALNTIVQADHYPMYIHCLDGRHVVGLVVMALRKLQCVDYTSMQLEYERFTKGEANNETAYIMDYTGSVTLPARVPQWLRSCPWFDSDGRVRRHPTLKVRQAQHPPSSTNTTASTTAALHSTTSTVGVVATIPHGTNIAVLSSSAIDTVAMNTTVLASTLTERAVQFTQNALAATMGRGRSPNSTLNGTTTTADTETKRVATTAAVSYVDLSAIGPLPRTAISTAGALDVSTRAGVDVCIASIPDLQGLSVRSSMSFGYDGRLFTADMTLNGTTATANTIGGNSPIAAGSVVGGGTTVVATNAPTNSAVNNNSSGAYGNAPVAGGNQAKRMKRSSSF